MNAAAKKSHTRNQPGRSVVRLDQEISNQSQRLHQNKKKGGSIISAHHLLVFLLLVPAAIGNKLNGEMISRGKFHSTIPVNARKMKALPCFCSIMQRHQVVSLRTNLPSDRRALATAAKNDDQAETSSSTFYERLNSPKHVCAPMVAQSDLPFRLMCEQLYNVDLSYTQMIHANNFVKPDGDIFRRNHLDVYPQSTVRDILFGKEDRHVLLVAPPQDFALVGLSDDEIEQSRKRILAAIAKSKGSEILSEIDFEVKPTIVQIASHNPDVAVDAAMRILDISGSSELLTSGATSPVSAIDLNLGCPQSIARKGRYGSFLHDESPQTTYDVLTELRSKLPQEIGVTAKIRLPPSQADADAGKLGNMSELDRGPQTIEERIQCLIDCGVDLITVHGRTRFENKATVAAADWDSVRQCVDFARTYSGDTNYPIISNGGIEFWDDVTKCFGTTNASGVMSSESLLENPGLFCSVEREVASHTTAKGLLERQLGYADIYLDYATLFPPLPGSLGSRGGSFNVIRSHLFKFLFRYLEENPEQRSWLGNQDLNTIKQARDLVSDLRSRYSKVDEEQLRLRNSSSNDGSWYRRHRGNNDQDESIPTLSIAERKQLAKLRIKKMKEERMKRSM